MNTPAHPDLRLLPRSPHFAMLGGREAVVRLVDAFYRQMDSRAQARTIRAMHAHELGATKEVLVLYLCQWLGGPADYSARRGEPRLRKRHLPFAIGLAERDAWLDCMRAALAETCADESLNQTLMASFARVADAMRNVDVPADAQGHGHARGHANSVVSAAVPLPAGIPLKPPARPQAGALVLPFPPTKEPS